MPESLKNVLSTAQTRTLADSPIKAKVVKTVSASQRVFETEDRYGAHNYHPLPVALCRAQGKKT